MRINRAAFLAASLAVCSSASAHEKWFLDGPRQLTSLRSVFELPTMIGIFVAIAVVIAATILWRMRNKRDLLPSPAVLGATDDRRAAFYGIAPFILGVHIAVPLLINGMSNRLFSPNNLLHGVWIYIFGLAQVASALSFFYGGFTRLMAMALSLVWIAGIFVVGLEPMLENIHYLGFAAFFFLAGRGPISIDRLLFPKLEPHETLMREAPVALRAGIGLSLVSVAFTEKLANLPLAESFLLTHPLNFMPFFGLAMSDRTFAICAGTVELIVGLLLLFGVFPRVVVCLAWLPFNLTLTVFNWNELVGHLPFYGALAVLLIWTSGDHEDRKLWLRGMREGPLHIPVDSAQ